MSEQDEHDEIQVESLEQTEVEARTARPGWRWAWPRVGRTRRTVVIAAIGAVLVGGGIGVAAAQSSTTTTTPAKNGTTAPEPDRHGPGPMGKFGHHGGPPGFGFGFGPGGALHGEFVTGNGSGGYRTIDIQRGTVTKKDGSTSITVKSPDGFEKEYALDSNTLVDAGRDGIGSVNVNDMVSVTAVVENGSAHAMNIQDATNLRNIRQHWAPPGAPEAPPSTSAPSSTT